MRDDETQHRCTDLDIAVSTEVMADVEAPSIACPAHPPYYRAASLQSSYLHSERSMAINTSKVVVGGLAAGLVANIIGYVGFGLMLGPRMEAEAVAVAPELAGRGMAGSAIAVTVVAQFVIGLLLVWIYAAIRPRFGPGMKTATYAALVVWVCGIVFHLDWLAMGLMTISTYVMATVVALVQLIPSAGVGAMLYKEEGSAT
jgi:hypothetical protein